MRAGSLSDPRVLAMLREHFLCVEMPLLSVQELIPNPEDVQLLERLQKDLSAWDRMKGGRPEGFYGGEHEVFLTPKGELVAVFQSLAGYDEGEHVSQGTETNARAIEIGVRRILEFGRQALERTHGKPPEGFGRFFDLEDARVVDAARMPNLKEMICCKDPSLVVWVRNDTPYYLDLAGREWIALSTMDVSSLVPVEAAVGAVREWPSEISARLAALAYPRQNVHVVLPVGRACGRIVATVTAHEDQQIHCRLEGELSVAGERGPELGPRPPAQVPFELATKVLGDLTWDARNRQLLNLRIVSEKPRLKLIVPFPLRKAEPEYHLGIELYRP